MTIAILCWGSLIWDTQDKFDKHLHEWRAGGPNLMLEFSRVSETRNKALTLVLDIENGEPCTVSYALSKREDPHDAICDLRSREGTTLKNIGVYFKNDLQKTNSREDEILKIIQNWATKNKIEVVIWTDLKSNFKEKSKDKKDFSIKTALSHIQSLDADGMAKALEYVQNAPSFIDTPLLRVLKAQTWFGVL